jgi:hypothetical protein
MFYNWTIFFTESGYGAYSYISGGNATINHVAYWGLYGLCVLGVLGWLSKPSAALSSLAVVAALGVIFSVPFLPPTDTSQLRSYASSLIVLAVLPAMGVAFLAEKLSGRIRLFSRRQDPFPGHGMTAWFSPSLILIMVLGPYLVNRLGGPPRLPAVACGAGTDSIVLHFDMGTYFNVIPDDASIADGMPNFHLLFYKGNSHGLADPNLINWATKVKPPVTIFDALDYRRSQNFLITSPTNILPMPGRLL